MNSLPSITLSFWLLCAYLVPLAALTPLLGILSWTTRLGLTALLAVTLAPSIAATPDGFAVALLSNFAVGLFHGAAVALSFEVWRMAGDIVDRYTGVTGPAGSAPDVLGGPFATLAHALALLAFTGAEGHVVVVGVIVRSARRVQLSATSSDLATLLDGALSYAFELAFPILVVCMLVDLLGALLEHVAPPLAARLNHRTLPPLLALAMLLIVSTTWWTRGTELATEVAAIVQDDD